MQVDSPRLNGNTAEMRLTTLINQGSCTLVYLLVFGFTNPAVAAPKRLVCQSETGQAAARYWSEQAERNRAYGQIDKANQMEQTAAFCERSAFSRKIIITFDDQTLNRSQEQQADFEMLTLCGLEGGETMPARILWRDHQYQISYYHAFYRTMRYFNVDASNLRGGFVDQRDFNCQFQSYGVSEGML